MCLTGSYDNHEANNDLLELQYYQFIFAGISEFCPYYVSNLVDWSSRPIGIIKLNCDMA